MGRFPHVGRPYVRCFDGDAHPYPLVVVHGRDKQGAGQEESGNRLVVDTFRGGMHFGHGDALCRLPSAGHRVVALVDRCCADNHLFMASREAISDIEEEHR